MLYVTLDWILDKTKNIKDNWRNLNMDDVLETTL